MKNAKSLVDVGESFRSSQEFRQAYVVARSSCSRSSVWSLNCLVERMKWFGIMGYLFSTMLYAGASVGIDVTSRFVSGFSNGLNGFFGVSFAESCLG